MLGGESVGIRHQEGLSLPVKPEGFVFSGLVDPVVDFVNGANVITVCQKSNFRSLEAFFSHLKPSLAKRVYLTGVDVGIGGIQSYEVDSGIAELGGMLAEDPRVAGVVVAVLWFRPVVKDAGFCELVTDF